MQYIWKKLEVLPKLISILDKATSVVIEFKPDDITFLTMAVDSTVALYIQVGEPIIQVKGTKHKPCQLQFFTTHLKQGVSKFKAASHGANLFIMKVVDDGLIFISKNDKTTLNTLKIKAMEGDLPDLKDIETGLSSDEWFPIPVVPKDLFDGLSGVDSKVDDMEFTIAPDKKNPSHGTLSLKFVYDAVEYCHIVQLSTSTAKKLCTKTCKSKIQSVLVIVLRNIIKICGGLDCIETKKRKLNAEEEEDGEFSGKGQFCLRVKDQGDPIGILFETNGIVVKGCVASKINEDDEEA